MILIIVIAVFVIGISIAAVCGGIWIYSSGRDAGIASVPTISPTPQPTPSPTATQTVSQQTSYSSDTTFVVLSATMSNGYYEVLTTDGRLLSLPNYYVWNAISSRGAYTARVIGFTNGIYSVDNVNLVYLPPQVTTYYYTGGTLHNDEYPTYYYRGGEYFVDDGTHTKTVSYRDTIGHIVYNGKPSHSEK